MKEIKIYINENLVFSLNELEVKILRDQIVDKEFEQVMKNWATSIFEYRLRHSTEQLINRWTRHDPIDNKSLLEKNGVTAIPTNQEDLITLIFEQPNYHEISQKEK